MIFILTAELIKKMQYKYQYRHKHSISSQCHKIDQFKAKDSQIKSYLLCLGNISKDFTTNDMKKKQRS